MSESINTLIGTFSSIDNMNSQVIEPNSLIAIDTSFNRIGINTVDPSYSIHVISNDLSGIISTPRLIISSLRSISSSLYTTISNELYDKELYYDENNHLKVHISNS